MPQRVSDTSTICRRESFAAGIDSDANIAAIQFKRAAGEEGGRACNCLNRSISRTGAIAPRSSRASGETKGRARISEDAFTAEGV